MKPPKLSERRTQEPSSANLDVAFYPATDKVDWEPLEKLISPGLGGAFMFMQADTDGRRYYKHSVTRRYLILDGEGRAYGPRGGTLPAFDALREALEWE